MKNGLSHLPEQCCFPVRGNINAVVRDINCSKNHSVFHKTIWEFYCPCNGITGSNDFYGTYFAFSMQVNFHLQKPTVFGINMVRLPSQSCSIMIDNITQYTEYD